MPKSKKSKGKGRTLPKEKVKGKGKKKDSLKDKRKARREALLNRERETNKTINAGSIGFFKDDLGEDVQFWKCNNADHVIDIIPYDAGANDPDVNEGEFTYGLFVYQHRDVGGKEGQAFICLDRTYGQPCPICQHRRQLEKNAGDEGLIKSLRTSRYPRSIYNVICYDNNEEEKGIQVFHTSYWLLELTLKKLGDRRRKGRSSTEAKPKTAHWSDPEKGKSIAFTREGEAEKTRFVGVQLLDRDYDIEEELIQEAHVLDDLIHVPTFEEVYEAYWGEEYDENSQQDEEGSSRNTRRRQRPVEAEEEEAEETEEEEASDEAEEEEAEELDDDGLDDDDWEGEEEEGEEEEGEEECQYDGDFGVDFNSLDGCDDCDDWDECQEAFETLEKEKKKKAKAKKGKGKGKKKR